MPLYDYKCAACGTAFSRMLPLARFDEAQHCKCGAFATKQLSAPAVRGDYAGYSCPMTGQWIEGRRAHEENLRKHGCRVLEPGESESARRHAVAEDVALDRAVEETTDSFIAGLSGDQRAQLASEVSAGASVAVERQ